jgi:hypothetical protein
MKISTLALIEYTPLQFLRLLADFPPTRRQYLLEQAV